MAVHMVRKLLIARTEKVQGPPRERRATSKRKLRARGKYEGAYKGFAGEKSRKLARKESTELQCNVHAFSRGTHEDLTVVAGMSETHMTTVKRSVMKLYNYAGSRSLNDATDGCRSGGAQRFPILQEI